MFTSNMKRMLLLLGVAVRYYFYMRICSVYKLQIYSTLIVVVLQIKDYILAQRSNLGDILLP